MKDDTKSVVSVNTIQSKSKRSSVSRDKAHLLKSDILSKEEEARLTREKREKMEEVRKKYSKRSTSRGSKARDGSESASEARTTSIKRSNKEGLRRKSPSGGTTLCTRDEDINIEEFMRADMHEINKEEDKL